MASGYTGIGRVGFEHIAEAWSGAALTPRGREITREPTFFSRQEDMLPALHRVEEARALFREELEIPLGGTEEIQELVARARKAAVLEGFEVSPMRHGTQGGGRYPCVFDGARCLWLRGLWRWADSLRFMVHWLRASRGAFWGGRNSTR